MSFDFVPLWLTFKLAALSAFFLFFCAMPLVFWLYFTPSRTGYAVRALVNMPLVLPPVVIGFTCFWF